MSDACLIAEMHSEELIKRAGSCRRMVESIAKIRNESTFERIVAAKQIHVEARESPEVEFPAFMAKLVVVRFDISPWPRLERRSKISIIIIWCLPR